MKESPKFNKKEYRLEFEAKHTETIEANGRTITIADVAPEHDTDKKPVLLAPAWACTIPVYIPALKQLSETGRRALSLNQPRTGRIELTPEESDAMRGFPDVEQQNAMNLVEVARAKRLSGIDLLAHSEGCVNAIAAALAHPELFDNIVLFAPPGFIGKDSPARLAKGWIGMATAGGMFPSLDARPATDEEKRAAEAEGRTAIDYPEIPRTDITRYAGETAASEAPGYLARNPVRAMSEAWSMASADLIEAVQRVRAHDIGVVVMSGVDDTVFPTEKMATLLKKGELDGFLSVRGGHGQLGESMNYIVVAEQMLTALDKKKTKPIADGTSD